MREKHQHPREEEEEEDKRRTIIKKKKRKKRSKNDSENREEALKAAEVRMCTSSSSSFASSKTTFRLRFVNLNFVSSLVSRKTRDIFRERDLINHPPFLDVHEGVSLIILM